MSERYAQHRRRAPAYLPVLLIVPPNIGQANTKGENYRDRSMNWSDLRVLVLGRLLLSVPILALDSGEEAHKHTAAGSLSALAKPPSLCPCLSVNALSRAFCSVLWLRTSFERSALHVF
jgi:hypothetical protein